MIFAIWYSVERPQAQGHWQVNAVRFALGVQPLILPRSVAIGDMLSYANEILVAREGRKGRFTCAGSDYFKRMQAEDTTGNTY